MRVVAPTFFDHPLLTPHATNSLEVSIYKMQAYHVGTICWHIQITIVERICDLSHQKTNTKDA